MVFKETDEFVKAIGSIDKKDVESKDEIDRIVPIVSVGSLKAKYNLFPRA